MKLLLRLFPLRVLLLISAVLLLILNVFSFYGLFNNKFSFLKFDNYIFPALTIFHFIYIYVLLKKSWNSEKVDISLRNIEYSLYFVYMVYIFKFGESIFRFMAYTEFKDAIIPETFFPIGIALMALYLLLLLLTLLTFFYRKKEIGTYNFDELHDTMDSWE